MIEIKSNVVGRLRTNSYLVWNPETMEGFITDPGRGLDDILTSIREEGVKVQGILLTHAHFDHSGMAEQAREALKVPIIAGEKEEETLENPEYNLSGIYTKYPFSLKADLLYKDGDEFTMAGFRIRVLGTPGHSQGGVCFYIPAEKILLSGDSLFAGTYGITHHPTGNHRAMICSVERLVTELPEDTLVYPGHGRTTTIAIEKAGNPARAEYAMLSEEEAQ